MKQNMEWQKQDYIEHGLICGIGVIGKKIESTSITVVVEVLLNCGTNEFITVAHNYRMAELQEIIDTPGVKDQYIGRMTRQWLNTANNIDNYYKKIRG